MPVDTSFYPQAQQTPPPNPLQMMSMMQGIQGQQLRNQLLQRTMGAQQAIGQIAAQSLRPDGTTDLAAYQQGIQGDPNAAFGAQDAANNAQAQATAQQALQAQQFDLAHKKLATIYQGIGSLADKPNVGPDDVQSLVGDYVKMGVLDPNHAASELQGIPSDPAQLKSWLRSKQMATLDADRQISQYSQKSYINTGAQDVSVNTAPLANTPPALTNTLSPGEAASPVAGPVGPHGEQTTTPLGQRVPMGTIATSQGPAQVAAQTAGGQLGAQAEAQFSQHRQQATQNAANFSLLRGDMGKMFTGAGAESRLALARAAQTAGIPVNADSITSTESAAKVLQQIINAQPNSGQSDKQLLSSITANPHLGLSADGLRLMSAVAEGNNNAQLAAGKAWDNAKSRGVGADQFNDRMPAIVSKLDPKVFQYEAAPPNLRHFITDGMSKAQLQQFHATLSEGMRKGWFK